MTHTSWLWFYVACMAAGAITILWMSRDPRGVPHYEYAAAAFIPIWSGLAYMASAFDQGLVEVAGRTVYVTRYADWIVTTPLLLAGLAWTAMFHVKKDKSLIVALMGADVVMIISGLIADLTADPSIKWVWYTVGCAALLAILWVTWGPLRTIARSQGAELERVYGRVAGLLTALWFGYPTIWALGPSGVGVLGSTTEVALFVLLPIASKVGFSLFDLSELRKLNEHQPSPALA